MNTLMQTEYENVSHFDGDNLDSIHLAFRSNILAMLDLKRQGLVKIDSVEVIFKAKTSPVIDVIKMNDEFWLSVALETWEDE